MLDYVLRFLAGGIAVSAFAALGDALRPKTFAGLFGAAPSIALAARRTPRAILIYAAACRAHSAPPRGTLRLSWRGRGSCRRRPRAARPFRAKGRRQVGNAGADRVDPKHDMVAGADRSALEGRRLAAQGARDAHPPWSAAAAQQLGQVQRRKKNDALSGLQFGADASVVPLSSPFGRREGMSSHSLARTLMDEKPA